MHVTVCAAITVMMWTVSLTVLLPFTLLLKYCKYFRDKWFAAFYTTLMPLVGEPKVFPLREKAFEILKKKLTRDELQELEVLEIGVGYGANLQFYPDNCRLTAVDMNKNFETHFHRNQTKFPKVTYVTTVIGMAENMPDVADATIDVVVCTYMLCFVQNIDEVLSEVKRVLKPGGQFLFAEHIAFSDSWYFTLQRMVAPLWKIYFGGCGVTKNTDDNIKAAFSEVILENATLNSVFFFVDPNIYGIAIK